MTDLIATRRRLGIAGALFVSAPMFSACGGSSGGAPSVAPTPAPTPSPSPSPPPPAPPPPSGLWPLAVGPTGRYLTTNAGQPFLIQADAPWSIVVQLNATQIDRYLDDRRSKGFNLLLINAIEHMFSSQTPPWSTFDGLLPFTPMPNFASPNDAYWQHVDYVVNGALARGMACLINPAYLGFAGGQSGWTTEIMNASTASLQSYGAFLARRYTQGNVVWSMGGDYGGTVAQRDKQWNIALGIRSVQPQALITAHNARADADAASHWAGYPSFNLNSIYTGFDTYDEAATAYARPGPLPFFLIEAYYENENGSTQATLRRQAYTSILAGACGQLFGNNPIWGFGEPNFNGGIGAAASLASLDTTGARAMTLVSALFNAFQWWKLQPRTDASLVTSGLGSGGARICPALASDRSFAMVWVPGSTAITVNMAALAPAAVRARWYDTAAGTYAAIAGSPFANSGVRTFTPGAEAILVLDAG